MKSEKSSRELFINAIQLRWENWNEICEFAGVGSLSEGRPEGFNPAGNPNIIGLLIPTSEGVITAIENDWIIKGENGQIAACKTNLSADEIDNKIAELVNRLKPKSARK
jgi:hypothetical protein